MNNPDLKRHFRFPAFPDETGVKLTNSREELLADLHLFTDSNIDASMKTVQPKTVDEKEIIPAETQNVTASNEMEPTGATNPAATTRQERFHGVPEKRNFPVGGKRTQHERMQMNSRPTKSQHTTTKITKPTDRYNGRSYFVPKYVPASLIPDEDQKKISASELIQSLKKAPESYLNFTTAPEETESSTPQARESFVATPPVTSPELGKKKSALERSLAGILADETEQAPLRNRYFED